MSDSKEQPKRVDGFDSSDCYPTSLSFDDINEFVHLPVPYEGLQNLCLSLAVKLNSDKRDTENDVANDIYARQVRGMAKYGTTIAENPLSLRLWLQHAYEECLDQAIYLKRAIQQLDG